MSGWTCPNGGTSLRRYDIGVFLCEDSDLCVACRCTPGDQGDCWCPRPDGAETTVISDPANHVLASPNGPCWDKCPHVDHQVTR